MARRTSQPGTSFPFRGEVFLFLKKENTMVSRSEANARFPTAESLLVREASGEYRLARTDEVIKAARKMLARKMRRGATLTSPKLVREFLTLKIGGLEHEVFVGLFADSQTRLIRYVELF